MDVLLSLFQNHLHGGVQALIRISLPKTTYTVVNVSRMYVGVALFSNHQFWWGKKKPAIIYIIILQTTSMVVHSGLLRIMTMEISKPPTEW